MSNAISIKQGLDIKLKGSAEKVTISDSRSSVYAIKPTDFIGLVPKLSVRQGDEVLAGASLFYDKSNPEVFFPSPVSGEVVEIKRGAKRKILEVKILADKEIRYVEYGAADAGSMSREQIIDKLLKSGMWSLIRQRPFSVVPDFKSMPKAIHISAFDTHPLAPDMDYIIEGQEGLFQKGLDVIAKLSDNVNLNINGKAGYSKPYESVSGVKINRFSGPHPTGNVGVQVNKLDPINKGESIWYLYPQDIINIGRFFESGKVDLRKRIALTGSEVKKPQYFDIVVGASIESIVSNNVSSDNVRYISGNALTGSKVELDSFVGYYDNQITILPEGDYLDFFLTDGWFGLGLNKLSVSRSYFNWLMPNKEYTLTTKLNGELRAFVVTGEMEKVFPFDIYPMQLLKAIMINDVDSMEQLGIYEVDAEDFALCEFINTSKIDVQDVVREGMESLRVEML